jgi:neutral trehalase
LKPVYILDACALIAYLNNEQGADIVYGFLKMLEDSSVSLLMRLRISTPARRHSRKCCQNIQVGILSI